MNPRKKTALIYVKTAAGGRMIINPNDLKQVVISGTSVTFVTSVVSRTANLSEWAIRDKLKPALRQRYNVLDVEGGRALKFQDAGKSHNLTVIHESGKVTCVFPKAFRGATLANNSVTVHGYNEHWTVPIQRQPNDESFFEAMAL